MARPETAPDHDREYVRCFHNCTKCDAAWSHLRRHGEPCRRTEPGSLCEPCEQGLQQQLAEYAGGQ